MEQSEAENCKNEMGHDGANMTETKPKETDSFLPIPAEDLELQAAASVNEAPETRPAENYKGCSFRKRFLVDLPFRGRFMHSVYLCWAIYGMGWGTGQMGPSFPDIRNLVGQDVETAVWLFTVHSFGYVIGSLSEGFLYERLNTLLTVVVAITTMAVTSAVLPWCPSFILMIVIKFISGLGGGCLEAIANADIASIWDEEGRPYMQALHFSYGFGAILSPMATEPFLSKKVCSEDPGGNQTGEHSYGHRTEAATIALGINISEIPACNLMYGQTRVQYAYLITGIILLSSAIPFFVKFLQSRKSQDSLKMKADKTNIKRPDNLPLALKSVLVTLLCSLLFVYAAVEDSFGSFLMTFCLQYLEWTKEQGSLASSLYWLMFAIGRFLGIFLVRWFAPGQLALVFIIFMIGSYLGFLLASITMTMTAVWLFVPLIGFSMSIICPCIYSWTEEIILAVSGMIAGLFAVSCAMGLVVNPVFIGYLIKGFGPISLPYLLLAQSTACIVLYLIIHVVVKYFVKQIKKKEMEIEVEVRKES